ncbi:NADAR family protein [Pseudoalteromonas luteoviolacea]|uniref:NADAR family protein n=1 Tax=Pseudoalteromonas luteoviolacea TaxID=43657 RepID=UPI001F181D38|nr:NADAR family protein [Pseudoalteromonas luteoviolacea]MCF6442481.1 NADAR family protein [Pseudoalteromonas luteoviolacea]
MAKTIKFFAKNDKYYQLSNFAGFGFELDGHYWKTMEHYFQAMKFIGTEQFDKIKNCGSPKQAKDLGQTRAIPIRSDWDSVKEEVMLVGLRKKFQDKALRDLLIATGKKELIEDSPFDKYWGIGANGKGKNRLGFLLMKLRDELKS